MTNRQVVMFNPFTGQPRDPRDIQSDPYGQLIWDGETPLQAASTKREMLAVADAFIRGKQAARAAPAQSVSVPVDPTPEFLERALGNGLWCGDAPHPEALAKAREAWGRIVQAAREGQPPTFFGVDLASGPDMTAVICESCGGTGLYQAPSGDPFAFTNCPVCRGFGGRR